MLLSFWVGRNHINTSVVFGLAQHTQEGAVIWLAITPFHTCTLRLGTLQLGSERQAPQRVQCTKTNGKKTL